MSAHLSDSKASLQMTTLHIHDTPARHKVFLTSCALFLGCLFAQPALPPAAAQGDSQQLRRLPVEVFRDKMMAGWLGQMVGVSFGAPTEFSYQGIIMPEEDVPDLYPGMANNAFDQDDLYVEMTFLKTLATYGLDVASAQAGIDFANSEYELWHANNAGRENLRRGIAPPDSGHPQYNGFADDIDYQIEADFAGLISPGMPARAVRLGETFGTIMNYGDGLYGGQFMSCLYAEAFFESNPQRLLEAGLACIPAQSQYAEAVRDVVRWWQDYPDHWERTWARVNEKYQHNPDYRRFSSNRITGYDPEFNIDAKINGAYVAMGLLYGAADPVKTMTIAMRSGQDSDCNPASVGGVLFTTIGFSSLEQEFASNLDKDSLFAYTDFSFTQLIEVSERLARESVLAEGGWIETDAQGAEVFVIPVRQPQPSPFAPSWEPAPSTGSVYNDAQTALIRFYRGGLWRDVAAFAPGWAVAECMSDPLLGLRDSIQGRANVLVTYPVSREIPCRLTRTVSLPSDSPALLHLSVGYIPGGDWTLVVQANGAELLRQEVGRETAPGGWLDVSVDLSAHAGGETQIDLLNAANGWSWEGGYWAAIEIIVGNE